MNIKKYTSNIIGAVAALLTFFSCQEETGEPGIREKQSIQLSGSIRLTDAAVTEAIYLRGMKKEGNNYSVYFNTTPFEPITLGENATEMKLTTTRYYPLSNPGEENAIHLFAFTNTVDGNMNMVLRAGHDELLANNGISKAGIETLNAEGVRGSSQDPVETLYFRHVMTQINVKVEVDSTEVDDHGQMLVSHPESVAFTLPEVITSGTYPLTAKELIDNDPNPTVATPIGTTLQQIAGEGTYYVIPTGKSLTGKPLKSLKIDNYTATNADLNKLEIKTEDGSDFVLLPGYAYNLTLKIRRLQVEVYAGQTTWTKYELGNDNVFAQPKILSITQADEYITTYPDDPITKVVIHSNDGKQYVGEPNSDGNMAFATLPKGIVKEVELYTFRGLLVKKEINKTIYNGINYVLTLPLGPTGMFLEDPLLPNSETNPYEVHTIAQFLKIRRRPAGHYKQMQNFEVDGFNMEGIQEDMGTFTGTYNGNGYTISKTEYAGSGIFGINQGIIKNLRTVSGTLNASGQDYAGVICGINEGTIIACTNEIRITMSEGTVGGICGKNEATGRIIGCVNSGNMESGSITGGICGENLNIDPNAIIGCINTGRTVYHYLSTDIIGGICGKSDNNSVNNTLSNCYWLYGTAAIEQGGEEHAVGNLPGLLWNDVTFVSQTWLTDPAKGCIVLNNILLSEGVVFSINKTNGGTIWPIPTAN